MRPSATATASARGWSGSMVMTVPAVRIFLDMFPSSMSDDPLAPAGSGPHVPKIKLITENPGLGWDQPVGPPKRGEQPLEAALLPGAPRQAHHRPEFGR